MINPKVLHTISYGLFIVSTELNGKMNGYIANTVFQLTAEPAKFGISCNKNNYTADMISGRKAFSVSVLAQSCGRKIVSKFGYRSGATEEKFNEVEYFDTERGVPVVTEKCVAWMELKLTDRVDLETHYLFIGEYVDGDVISDEPPLTYSYYLTEYKGVAPKNAPSYISKELRKQLKEKE
jgi:flavin reductase (DIM6/NTAB) family NADH-FMN oxidoreductase RutF